jgi:hypothetical protein
MSWGRFGAAFLTVLAAASGGVLAEIEGHYHQLKMNQ